jgi:hypothetical protein
MELYGTGKRVNMPSTSRAGSEVGEQYSTLRKIFPAPEGEG